MILGILFGFFLLLLVYLIWMPVVLCVDTVKNEYYIQLKGLAKAKIESHKEEMLILKLKIFFLRFQFYPLRKNKSATKKKELEKHKSKKQQSKISLRTALRILKSFKVKRFLLNMDTGDCIYNAKIYPLFVFLNYRIGGFNINFDGKNQLTIYLQNTPLRIIRSIINI
jgi:hypothetical protein